MHARILLVPALALLASCASTGGDTRAATGPFPGHYPTGLISCKLVGDRAQCAKVAKEQCGDAGYERIDRLGNPASGFNEDVTYRCKRSRDTARAP